MVPTDLYRGWLERVCGPGIDFFLFLLLKKKEIKMTKNEYENGEAVWSRDKKSIQSDFICRPYVLKTLGDVNDKDVADLGCGEGYLSRLLASKGAFVVAFDNSPKMIHLAKKKSSKGIRLLVGDITNIHFIKDASMDKALSVNVVPHLTFERMLKANQETFRILKKGGEFVFAAPNPEIYTKKPRTGWINYDKEQFVFEKNKKSSIELFSCNKNSFHADVYPHSMQEYTQALEEAGFRIVALIKPLATREDINQFPEMWGQESEFPFYVVFKAIKE